MKPPGFLFLLIHELKLVAMLKLVAIGIAADKVNWVIDGPDGAVP